MLNYSKSSFRFRLKLHWQIHPTLCDTLTIVQCHSFQNLFDLTFVAELVLITLLITATIRFTAWKQDFSTSNFFVEESCIPRIMFLVCVAAHSGKNCLFLLEVNWSVQFLGDTAVHWCCFLYRTMSSKFSSDSAKKWESVSISRSSYLSASQKLLKKWW